MDSSKKNVIAIARSLDIDLIRFTDAAPFIATRREIERSFSDGTFHDIEWPESFIQQLTDPQLLLKGAKTILVAAECYHRDWSDHQIDARFKGRIAPYTRYNAYDALKEKLNRLVALLSTETEGKYRFAVRSNKRSIAEKEAAVRSGLGFYGKNGIVITKKYGSMIVLGVIATDLEIEPDKPLNIDCGNCARCLDACPTRAFPRPYSVAIYDCLQRITEREHPITEEIEKVWEDRFYGCSTCQDVCPFNQKIAPKKRTPTHGVVGEYVDLEEILNMDESAFQKKFAGNQILSRGLGTMKRNAKIVLANLRKRPR